MRARHAFRFLLPVAAAALLLISAPAERARADAKDVQQALAGYQFMCAMNRIYRTGLAETESKWSALLGGKDWQKYDALQHSLDYLEERVEATGKLCNEYRQKFISEFTAYLIDVALTEQAEEKPAAKPKPEAETTRRKPQPEGEATRTKRKPKPEAESRTTRRPVAKRGEEAPAGPSHDPTASALVGVGVGIAIGRGLGGGGGGGGGTIGGGGGGKGGGGGGAGGWTGKGKGH